MGIKVALEHRTSYTFDRLVEVHPHVVRLRPAPHSRTPIEAYSLTVEPADHFVNWQQDAFGNFLARLVFPSRTRSLTITVGLIADLKVINPFDFFIEEYAERIGFEYPKALAEDLKPYLRPVDENDEGSGPGELAQAWVKDFSVAAGTRTIDFLVALNRAVNADVGYSVRMEPGVQAPDFTLRTGIGSCRDSAWLLVSILRQMGLAARFVSGYLVQLTSDVQALDGPSGPTADFTDLHAWTEVYIPGAGWIGLDPTSGLFAGEGHIPLSATPHPASSAPITGATEPCETTLDFSNLVTRVHEDPRVTLPYTGAAWDAIQSLGARIDDRLADGDVRLTVGGEPTFVSIDNQVDPEWTTDADGPHKRERASELAARLKTQWAPQGLVHRSQGKWYPGEPLPRWQIGLYWRADGAPLWTNEALLADPWSTEPQTIEVPPDAARRLLDSLADGLGLPASQVRPAYEDALSRLAASVRQPAGEPVAAGDDLAADASDARAELLERLDQTVTEPAAYVLPLHRLDDDTGWASADWQMRRGRLVLLDGDSPAGLRLPLKSVSWQPPRPSFPADPSTRRGALVGASEPEPDDAPAPIEDAEGAPPTAMVAEVRDDNGVGLLHVFLPPTEELEHFVDLVSRIEAAAVKTDFPVVIEGYGPPPDPRLVAMTVTPDPGVIEVNVAPTASFAEQRQQLETLYEQARLSRLSTESFDFDGTHGGTGGGNHITLGGLTPADSPMLRRPDLLVSMLTYWQRHPALSYLFAGRFIGTTSQAPRVDEGRSESLYELEIAFAEIARLTSGSASSTSRVAPLQPAAAKPWITDRALRHLLTDITGNTHRAEFCIDKLYSPDSARGRLGLLELRGFEMPPHFQMAMVQSLLVRALVAWFWDEPLRAPLIRHG
ncbi:MAG TPA: transglutaminase family protein, partial [Mycobacterium sp.]|nr:transglutaminase family protein [Mycobacterium sp.]